jgi:hypothetical protein
MSLTQAPSPVRPKVLVARRIFPEGLARLEEHCEIDYNDQIHPLSNAELANRLADKQGALVTGSEQVGTQALSPVELRPVLCPSCAVLTHQQEQSNQAVQHVAQQRWLY